MKITVDGAPVEVRDGLTVAALLQQQGEPADHVLVEINQIFVPPAEHTTRVLAQGDEVEIILPAFGG